jgi:hypothetical protein
MAGPNDHDEWDPEQWDPEHSEASAAELARILQLLA